MCGKSSTTFDQAWELQKFVSGREREIERKSWNYDRWHSIRSTGITVVRMLLWVTLKASRWRYKRSWYDSCDLDKFLKISDLVKILIAKQYVKYFEATIFLKIKHPLNQFPQFEVSIQYLLLKSWFFEVYSDVVVLYFRYRGVIMGLLNFRLSTYY